jgi:hypothetical protein
VGDFDMSLAQGKTSLAAIITAARAGSIGFAAAMFEAGGWAARTDDPAALATGARLLKDSALRATGADRQRLLAAAAQAYGAANQLRPQPYTCVNEATMRLLAGDREAATAIARALLEWLARGEAIAETPYFIAATRAEAHLLCGDVAAAAEAMRRACLADPDGWSDRASTLRQLRLILDATGAGQQWLEGFRSPRSLNFAGHLGVSPAAGEVLRSEVAAWMAAEDVGFGFGALAAGADIIIAEALLASGGDLHVILPTSPAAFVAQSVAPYGASWVRRFEDCLAAAHSVQGVTSLAGAYEPLASKLAADVAMGATVLNARMLESQASQLLVIDDGPGRFGAGSATGYIGERWRHAGRQHCIVAPRSAPVLASSLRRDPEGRADRRLAAMLMIAFDGLDHCDEARFAEALDSVIAPFRQACAELSVQPDLTLPMGNARLVAFGDPDAAWCYARALLGLKPMALPLRLAGHYALAHWLDDPTALVGRGTAELAAIAASALPGVLTASETLASALFVNLADDMLAEHVGEAGPLKLYALTPQAAANP